MKGALDVAVSLLAVRDRLEAGDAVRRVGMSALFEQISDCLASLAVTIRRGEVPGIGLSARLLTHAQSLRPAVAKELGDANADMLGHRLSAGYDLDRLGVELSSDTSAGAVAALEEASGKFRVLALDLDVPGYRLRTAVSVDLGESLSAAFFEMAKRLGTSPADLAAAGVLEFLEDQPGFSEAVTYVLQKNNELYRRLDR